MENRIGRATIRRDAPNTSESFHATTQADEALRRARTADFDIHRALARRAGLMFLRGLTDMTRQLPSPTGVALRITVTVIDSGEDLGSVDVDSTNLDDLGRLASRRAATFHRKPAPDPAPTGKPALRLVGGDR
ncbi:MAG TPA: hypothetical protein VFY14_09350 [Streptomyces sp.]|nr:hypothetical protein [Streptomyces sp.]